jgi:hypothetical protein
MGVARQVGEHLLGTAERRLATAHPSLAIQLVEVGQVGGGQLTGLDCRFQRGQGRGASRCGRSRGGLVWIARRSAGT